MLEPITVSSGLCFVDAKSSDQGNQHDFDFMTARRFLRVTDVRRLEMWIIRSNNFFFTFFEWMGQKDKKKS